ncbi:hypothetical protein B5F34_15550 [Mediterranea sp. An20]|nr:hypothetical protein B5F34_15550 [Mediterranea sp. An20]
MLFFKLPTIYSNFSSSFLLFSSHNTHIPPFLLRPLAIFAGKKNGKKNSPHNENRDFHPDPPDGMNGPRRR